MRLVNSGFNSDIHPDRIGILPGFFASVSLLFRMFKSYHYCHSFAVLLTGGGKLL